MATSLQPQPMQGAIQPPPAAPKPEPIVTPAAPAPAPVAPVAAVPKAEPVAPAQPAAPKPTDVTGLIGAYINHDPAASGQALSYLDSMKAAPQEARVQARDQINTAAMGGMSEGFGNILTGAGNWLKGKVRGVVPKAIQGPALQDTPVKPLDMGNVMATGQKLYDQYKAKATPQQLNDYARQVFGNVAATQGRQIENAAKSEFANKETGGWGNYLMNNKAMWLLPLGLMGLLSGNKIGQVMGVLAMAGGAGMLGKRLMDIKDPAFLTDFGRRDQLTKSQQWTPDMEKAFVDKWGASRVRDIGAASQLLDVKGRYKEEAGRQFDQTLPDVAAAEPAAEGAPIP